jgi:hypothetical protein
VAAAFDSATAEADPASAELNEARIRAYGRRDEDASDAWDHAIKAVEAILIPIVVPEISRRTLGRVIQQLDRGQPQRSPSGLLAPTAVAASLRSLPCSG